MGVTDGLINVGIGKTDSQSAGPCHLKITPSKWKLSFFQNKEKMLIF